ncbi:MAG: alpha-E domain-containing protein [Cyclobacteriaceae bacterium]
MLSRVADSVFWMARYLERTDNLLRVLRTDYIASQDELVDYNWQLLADTFGDVPKQKMSMSSYRDALHHLVLSRQHESSVFNNIVRVRENARSVQDYITKELWQSLNDYYHRVRDPQTESLINRNDPVTAFDILLRESIIFYGTVDVTMSRGEGYTFLNLGKYLERALQSIDTLEFKRTQMAKSDNESIYWKYLLYALSGYEFHTKFYKNALQTEEVIHQVLYNLQFPHSVGYSLAQMDRYFQRLKDFSHPSHFTEIDQLMKQLISTIQEYQKEKGASVIEKLIPDLRLQFTNLNNRLATLYFGYPSIVTS